MAGKKDGVLGVLKVKGLGVLHGYIWPWGTDGISGVSMDFDEMEVMDNHFVPGWPHEGRKGSCGAPLLAVMPTTITAI